MASDRSPCLLKLYFWSSWSMVLFSWSFFLYSFISEHCTIQKFGAHVKYMQINKQKQNKKPIKNDNDRKQAALEMCVETFPWHQPWSEEVHEVGGFCAVPEQHLWKRRMHQLHAVAQRDAWVYSQYFSTLRRGSIYVPLSSNKSQYSSSAFIPLWSY